MLLCHTYTRIAYIKYQTEQAYITNEMKLQRMRIIQIYTLQRCTWNQVFQTLNIHEKY